MQPVQLQHSLQSRLYTVVPGATAVAVRRSSRKRFSGARINIRRTETPFSERYSVPRNWSYDANAKINSGLALAGNTLLFTTFSRRLVAIDVRDGHELWHANVPNIVMSTPIVAGTTVYVGTGTNTNLVRTLRTHFSVRNVLLKLQFGNEELWGIPQGDEVAAFDLHTGALRWKHRTLGEDMPSAVYDGGRLIFANGDSHAYALRADTGAQLWSTHLGSISTMASAVLADRAVVVGVCKKTTW